MQFTTFKNHNPELSAMIKYFLFIMATMCINCTAFDDIKLQQRINATSDSWLSANRTCNDDPQIIQTLRNTLQQLNDVQTELTTLTCLTTSMMVVTLFTLFAYVPLLYTTYKQISVAEKRITQIAPGR
jgi:hypothetical protein